MGSSKCSEPMRQHLPAPQRVSCFLPQGRTWCAGISSKQCSSRASAITAVTPFLCSCNISRPDNCLVGHSVMFYRHFFFFFFLGVRFHLGRVTQQCLLPEPGAELCTQRTMSIAGSKVVPGGARTRVSTRRRPRTYHSSMPACPRNLQLLCHQN